MMTRLNLVKWSLNLQLFEQDMSEEATERKGTMGTAGRPFAPLNLSPQTYSTQATTSMTPASFWRGEEATRGPDCRLSGIWADERQELVPLGSQVSWGLPAFSFQNLCPHRQKHSSSET